MGALSIGTGNPARPVAFHLRAEGYEMHQRKTLLAGAGLGLSIAAALAMDRRQAISVQELERRQKAAAGPTRAERKLVVRQAVGDLRAVSEGHIVLGHIHPRWLREAANQALARHEPVDEAWIAARRALGPV